jgi:D-inositol-3-phosphate glycosyltransferase
VLADLLRTPSLLARLATGSRPHAERFSWEHTAYGLLVAYREAMAELDSRKPARL